MKPMTISRHKFTGDLWKFVRRPVGSESELEYYFAKSIEVTAGLDPSNRMTIRCKEPLALGFIVKNIKDSDGNLILSDIAWQIVSTQPVLNAFNSIDSYTMKAVKYAGTLE
jgi:hypothetical protein